MDTRHRRFLLIPVLITTVAILGAGAYVLTGLGGPVPGTNPEPPAPASSPSAGTKPVPQEWKTYTNDMFHFRLSYPPDWATAAPDNQEANIVRLIAPDESVLMVTVNPDSTKTLSEFLAEKDRISDTAWEGKPAIRVRKTTILEEGIAVERTEDMLAAGLSSRVIYRLIGKTIVLFAAYPSAPDGQHNLADGQLETVSGSFRFAAAPGTAKVRADTIYASGQLTDQDRAALAQFRWDPIAPLRSGDRTRQLYLVDCIPGNEPPFTYVGIINTFPNVPAIAETVVKALVENHYGGFPDAGEIAAYQKATGRTFTHDDSGINGVLLNNGTLDINFYDSVAAYGGGSARVACMTNAVRYTMLQFPAIQRIRMCINTYPGTSAGCEQDFQP